MSNDEFFIKKQKEAQFGSTKWNVQCVSQRKDTLSNS